MRLAQRCRELGGLPLPARSDSRATARARVGEGWGEGRFCGVPSSRLHPLTPPVRGDPLPQGERVTERAARHAPICTERAVVDKGCNATAIRST
jgi:hypothetical protein